jgi:isocitrate dehydrogenase (NAD+)
MVEEGIANKADPRSILKAAEMLLRHIGLTEKAEKLITAIEKASEDKSVVPTGTKEGPNCTDFTNKLLEII